MHRRQKGGADPAGSQACKAEQVRRQAGRLDGSKGKSGS
jgi:hypothetical protein